MEYVQDLWVLFKEWMAASAVRAVLKAGLILFAGWFCARIVRRWVHGRKLHAQAQMILRRVLSYGILTVAVIWALRELGFQLSALLGAAGLFTVAIGFAARTSISNLISGVFLIGERPFVVGDTIKVGETNGEVLTIDLMSVKLRTFDNLLVRIPNETLLNKEVTNLSHFPIRRVDFKISVAYRSDLGKVKKTLDAVADKNPLCLVDPKPVFTFLSYGASGIDLQYSVWGKREKFAELKSSIGRQIKDAFDAADIEFPFPHVSLHTGSRTEPFPVRMVAEVPEAPSTPTVTAAPAAADDAPKLEA